MKRLLLPTIALLSSLVAFGQTTAKAEAQAPQKKVLSSYRIEPKPGHAKELEAALAAHAQKFHHGDQAWRVGEILSGPDGGMYHITEGPTSWTALDGRGDLGPEHMKDYETNIMPHAARMTGDTFGVYEDELSTTGITQYSNKVGIMHLVVKPGRGPDARDALKHWKAIYEKLGLHVAVWHSAWSGENSFSVVYRFVDGLKDLDRDVAFRKAAEDLYGPNEYLRLQDASAANYSKAWSELIEFKPELSSK